MKKFSFLTIILIIVSIIGCNDELSPEHKAIEKEVVDHRSEKDFFMANSADSPLSEKGKAEFSGLKYFDFNPDFIFKSKLFQYEPKDTVIVKGTKGEDRQYVKYGYVKIDYQGNTHQVNVYESSYKGKKYYSIWFTDKTTNDESYGVGRYLDFQKSVNPEKIYTIDFNYAYNPYCAYNSKFSCAIPSKEDHLDIAIETGEKKYH